MKKYLKRTLSFLLSAAMLISMVPAVYIAAHHSVEEIAKIIGVDSLGYLSLDGIKKIACGKDCGYCTACFDGVYPTVTPSSTDRSTKYDKKISDNK